jgi:3-hydroxybutyryl-CoA dehydrogenase
MKLEEIHRISVVGAGLMGHGIAQTFIMAGYPVMLYDIDRSILERATANIEQNLKLFSRFDLISEAEIGPCLDRLTTTVDLKACVQEGDFILEAATEDVTLKQELFEEIESYCKDEAILASNTSSLTMAEMGVRVKKKERLVITHWFNPPHIVPTVEVVRAPWTSDETLDTAYALHKKLKKLPVKINRELPGFVVNRIQTALAREVFSLYDQGIASAEDIDRAVRGSIGFRLASIGPLQTVDFGGVKLWLRAYQNLAPVIESSPGPPKALQRLAEEGHEGIKTGKGFYDYSGGEADEAMQRRDREFLNRLKNLYWQRETEK